jgi:hypothetical protein
MIDTKRAQMLGGDPADRKEASYWYRPEDHDKPENLWADEWIEMCRKDNLTVCPKMTENGIEAFLSVLGKTDNDQLRAAKREAVVELLRQISDMKNCPIEKLQYRADILLAGFELSDLSATDIGKKHNMTRAAPSKQIVELRKRANPNTISRSQKSIESRKTYALSAALTGQLRKPKPQETQLQKEARNICKEALQELLASRLN